MNRLINHDANDEIIECKVVKILSALTNGFTYFALFGSV